MKRALLLGLLLGCTRTPPATSVDTARTLVFRSTYVGPMAHPPKRRSYSLRLVTDGRAELIETVEVGEPWKNVGTRTYVGTWDRANDAFNVRFPKNACTGPSKCGNAKDCLECRPRIVFRCIENVLEVRPPNAGFVPGHACDSEAGPPPMETNATPLTPITVLTCEDPKAGLTLELAEPPGVERYRENWDCGGKIDVLRKMAP